MSNAKQVFLAVVAVFHVSIVFSPSPLAAQTLWSAWKGSADAPKYEVEPFWPKPLPGNWVTGEHGGTCVDTNDHVFIVTRDQLWPKEPPIATLAPAVIEFDPAGNVVRSWGDRKVMPATLHGCFVDHEGNIWIVGDKDGIVQKYTRDGKMLLQIGTKGKFDSADNTDTSATLNYAMNSSREYLNSPTGVTVDPANGDVYISDGYGNRRIVVFDRTGKYLRQWRRQGSLEEIKAGVGGVFLKQVHCINMGIDGLLYVCDRAGERVQIFDKMGNYKRSILLPAAKRTPYTGPGTICGLAFSRDTAQKYLFVSDCTDDLVRIVDRASGKEVASFGRPGHQLGNISSPHAITVDSKNSIYVAESLDGRRIQKFSVVGASEAR